MRKDLITLAFSLWIPTLQSNLTVTSSNAISTSIFPESELAALRSLYDSAGGIEWEWNEPQSMYGYPWNFTELSLSETNPCTANWQGITCLSEIKDGFVHYHVLDVVLNGRNLVGNVPSNLSQLTFLQELILSQNGLTSTVPAELGQLSDLIVMDLSMNLLTGRLPVALGSLSQLSYVFLENNLLDGSLPENIFTRWTNVTYLDLGTNSLTGSLPGSVTHLVSILNFFFDGNELDGSLPNSLFHNLTALLILQANNNLLTGTLPSQVALSPNLHEIDLHTNFMHGPIYTLNFESLTDLYLLYLYGNIFSGLIPDSIGQLTSLLYLGLSNNALSGSLPRTLPHLTELTALLLASNRLTGPLSTLFLNSSISNASLATYTYPQLVVLDVSGNSLTGPLPVSLSSLPALKTFAAAVNCIQEATLPDSYCSANVISALVLDGLNAGHHCPGQRNQRVLNRPAGIAGSIPACLFRHPTLRVLHLSGNSISGSLPTSLNSPNEENNESSTTLDELVLSHNSYTGSLPSWLWRPMFSSWINLDLSFNRFSGYLSSADATFPEAQNASLALDLNRLSGKIPSDLSNVVDINILRGNLFSCGISSQDRHRDLPVNDPSHESYFCGSDAINVTLICWAVFLLTFFTCVLFFRIYTDKPVSGDSFEQTEDSATNENYLASCIHTSWARLFHYLAEVKSIAYPSVSAKTHHLTASNTMGLITPIHRQVSKLVGGLTLVLLLVFLPLYAILTTYFGVYKSQYIWTVSACYLEGTDASVVVLVLCAGILFYFDFVVSGWRQGVSSATLSSNAKTLDKSKTETAAAANSYDSYKSSLGMRLVVPLVRWIMVLINVVLVVAVNAGYVYVLTQQQNLDLVRLAFLTLALSLFKVGWSWLVVHQLNHIASFLLTMLQVLPEQYRDMYPVFSVSGTAAIAIFNNILAPYTAELAVNPDCFLYVFTAAPAVQSHYSINAACASTTDGDSICTESIENVISFQPPFQYSYLCSSSLITSFALVFLLRYLLSSILVPGACLLGQQVTTKLYAQSRCEVPARWIARCLPWQWRPKALLKDQLLHATAGECGHNPLQDRTSMPSSSAAEMNREEESAEEGNPSFHLQSLSITSNPAHIDPASTPSGSKSTTTTNADHMTPLSTPSAKETVVRLVNDVALLLTYGVLFPPLALVLCVAVVVEERMLWQHWAMVRWLESERLQFLHGRPESSLHPVTVSGEEKFDRESGAGVERTVDDTSLSESRKRNKTNEDDVSQLLLALQYLPWLAAVFWSFTLLDTLGSTQRGAAWHVVWIVFAMCLVVPSCSRLVCKLYYGVEQEGGTREEWCANKSSQMRQSLLTQSHMKAAATTNKEDTGAANYL